MAHTFDTGLDKPVRTVIMQGVVSMLSGLLRANGGYLSAVVPWGGVVRSWTDDEGVHNLFEALNGRTPAIAVAVGDLASSPAGAGGFTFKEEIDVLLYHASNHMRDITIGRLLADAPALFSDIEDPGLHVAMAHAKELVVGLYAGGGVAHPAIKQVRPDREEELTTRDELTIWLQSFRVTLSTTIRQNRTVTQLLNSIRVRTTQEDGEARLPDPASSPTTVDANIDNLP